MCGMHLFIFSSAFILAEIRSLYLFPMLFDQRWLIHICRFSISVNLPIDRSTPTEEDEESSHADPQRSGQAKNRRKNIIKKLIPTQTDSTHCKNSSKRNNKTNLSPIWFIPESRSKCPVVFYFSTEHERHSTNVCHATLFSASDRTSQLRKSEIRSES